MSAFTKDVYFQICLIAMFVIICNSLCHMPCNYIKNERYTDGEFTYQFNCQNTSEAFAYDENGDFFAKEICIERSGPFKISRWEPMGMYTCFIDPMVDERSRVVKAFRTDMRSFDNEPNICQACTGPFIKGTFVIHGALRRPYPPMPCNRPRFCPDSDNPDDASCVGGEYRILPNSESCCKDGKRRRRRRHSHRYTYGYRG